MRKMDFQRHLLVLFVVLIIAMVQALAKDVIDRLRQKMQLNKEVIDCYTKIFSRFDKDGNGAIVTDELRRAWRKLGKRPTEIELQDMMDIFDANGNGTVELSEFLATIAKKMEPTEENQSFFFNFYDINGDGGVDLKELRKVNSFLRLKYPAKKMMKEYDLDGDGKISEDEYGQRG